MFIKIPRGAVTATLGDVLEAGLKLSLLCVETAQSFTISRYFQNTLQTWKYLDEFA